MTGTQWRSERNPEPSLQPSCNQTKETYYLFAYNSECHLHPRHGQHPENSVKQETYTSHNSHTSGLASTRLRALISHASMSSLFSTEVKAALL